MSGLNGKTAEFLRWVLGLVLAALVAYFTSQINIETRIAISETNITNLEKKVDKVDGKLDRLDDKIERVIIQPLAAQERSREHSSRVPVFDGVSVR